MSSVPHLTKPHRATVPDCRISCISPFLTLHTDVLLPLTTIDGSMCITTFILKYWKELDESFPAINSTQTSSSHFEYIQQACFRERNSLELWWFLYLLPEWLLAFRKQLMCNIGLLSKCFVETTMTVCSKFSQHNKQSAILKSPPRSSIRDVGKSNILKIFLGFLKTRYRDGY